MKNWIKEIINSRCWIHQWVGHYKEDNNWFNKPPDYYICQKCFQTKRPDGTFFNNFKDL